MAGTDFDAAIEGFRQALSAYMTGNPDPVIAWFSRRQDVTLANPLGPPRRGPFDVDAAIAEGASYVSEGSVRGFDEVSRYSTPDLGYVVQIERTQAKMRGAGEVVPIALRVTMIFRREGDDWKVAHRHADPITTTREVESVRET